MKLLIHREKREVVDGRVRIVSKEKQYFITELSKDVDTLYGKVSKDDLAKPSGSVITSSTGKEFVLLDASFTDIWKQFKKLPQTVPLKDIGFIIAETGLNKDSIVVEGGVGSGALAAALANVVKHLTSYEVREDCIATAKENLAPLQFNNHEIKQKSLYDGIDEKDVDAVILDVPEPWQVVPHAEKALKVGGFFVSYVPSITQVQQVVEAVNKSGVFFIMKTAELIERPWVVDGRRVRPNNTGIGHSGFITIARKIRS